MLIGLVGHLLSAPLNGANPSPDEFFGRNPAALAGVAAPGVYPYGSKFPFGAYSAQGQNQAIPESSNLQRIAQQGFTLAGPYYHDDWQDFRYVREAAGEGLQVTYQVRPHPALVGVSVDDRPGVIESLSDDQIRASVRQQVQAALADAVAGPAIARWSLQPEELRYWYDQELRYLRLTREAIRQAESAVGAAKRPFWMYEPNHRNAEAMKETGRYQDIVSKGVYLTTRYPEHDQRVGFARWSFDQITAAAKDLSNVPQGVFALYEDFQDPAIGTDAEAIRRIIRHDVYLGLVNGLKGVQVFSMWEHRPNLTTHNEQFEAYGSVATDLTGELNLQRPLLFGERRDGIEFRVLAGDPTIDYTHTDGKRHHYDSLSTLDVSIDGSRYVFMVNSGRDPMRVELSGLPLLSIADDLFNPDGPPTRIANRRLQLDLEPLGVKAHRFRPLAGDLSGDGLINAADYTIYRDSLQAPDGVLSAAVFAEWAREYGSRGASFPLIVPEPLSHALLGPAFLMTITGLRVGGGPVGGLEIDAHGVAQEAHVQLGPLERGDRAFDKVFGQQVVVR